MVLTRAYPITANAVPSLSHNPVELWVLILEVMRRVFKTIGDAVAPSDGVGGQGVVAVSSTHRFRDWRIEGFCGLSRDGVHPDREKTGRTLREALENIDATE